MTAVRELSCIFGTRPANRAPGAETYRRAFHDHDPAAWEGGTGDAVFKAVFADCGVATLAFPESPGLGFSIRFNARPAGQRTWTEAFSLSDPAALTAFHDAGDDMIAPVGTFVPGPSAFACIEAFLRDPSTRPACVAWVDSSGIPWPRG